MAGSDRHHRHHAAAAAAGGGRRSGRASLESLSLSSPRPPYPAAKHIHTSNSEVRPVSGRYVHSIQAVVGR